MKLNGQRSAGLACLTNLPDDSVANASQVISLDKGLLTEHVGKLTRSKLELVLAGLDAVLGR
jgi:mRNA interferase MazF